MFNTFHKNQVSDVIWFICFCPVFYLLLPECDVFEILTNVFVIIVIVGFAFLQGRFSLEEDFTVYPINRLYALRISHQP